jgi:hypothetical protein
MLPYKYTEGNHRVYLSIIRTNSTGEGKIFGTSFEMRRTLEPSERKADPSHFGARDDSDHARLREGYLQMQEWDAAWKAALRNGGGRKQMRG